MRSADAATYVRTAMALVVVYLVLIKFVPAVIIFLIALVIALDGLDGYMAVYEESDGKISFIQYLSAAMGDRSMKEKVSSVKQSIKKHAPHGARMDVAGDRVVEYSFWIVFTYLHVLPIYVLLIVIIRHSFVDALMASKGTSSKMKTSIGKAMYSSNIARGGINVVKFLAFSYLVLMYIAGYPAIIGYVLVGILVAYILARGVAEVYESMKSND
jgi:phosphatidylglycerophosphate synthase